jgi:hypothetical protein
MEPASHSYELSGTSPKVNRSKSRGYRGVFAELRRDRASLPNPAPCRSIGIETCCR